MGGDAEGSPDASRQDRPVLAADWHSVLRARYDDGGPVNRADLPYGAVSFGRTPPALTQPSLAEDVFCLHRGGAKRVHRTRDGRRSVHDVPAGGFTVLARHRGADWLTEGPIDYVHITLRPGPFERLVESETGRPAGAVSFRDVVGQSAPLLAGLAQEMLRVASMEDESQLYVDTLFSSFTLALLRHCTHAPPTPAPETADLGVMGGLAGWRLRQIVDFMRANSSRDVGLQELVEASGLSRAHFFRAFRQSTGATPGQFLERLRVEQACHLLERGLGLAETCRQSGFNGRTAMSRAFRRVLNVSPGLYRRWRG